MGRRARVRVTDPWGARGRDRTRNAPAPRGRLALAWGMVLAAFRSPIGRRGSFASRRASATGALALGAAALGAFAIGGLAVAALAIRRLAIGRARIGVLEIDELHVRSARGLPPPPAGPDAPSAP